MTQPQHPGFDFTGKQLGEASGVTFRCLGAGRLVLIMPLEERTGKTHDGKADQQQMICDVVVLPNPDGSPQAPVLHGGKADNKGQMIEPDTLQTEITGNGWLISRMMIPYAGMLFILRPLLEQSKRTGRPAGIVGRLWNDPQYNGAWKISGDGHEPTAAELNMANLWGAAVASGQFVNCVPQPIAQIPRQAPAPQYAQAAPQQAPQAWPQQAQPGYAPNPQYAQPQAPQGWPQQGPVNPAYPPQAPAPVAPQGWPQQAPVSAQPMQQAPQGWPQQAAPNGWDQAQQMQQAAQGWPQNGVPAQQYGPTDMNAPTGL